MNKNLPTSKSMNIPVMISEHPIRNDPTLSGYETPQFQHKGKPSQNGNEATNFVEKEQKKEGKVKEMDEVVHDDINQFVRQFGNTKGIDDKVKVLAEGSKRLHAEAEEFRVKAMSDLDELIEGKKVALRLNNLMNRYIAKMTEDSHGSQIRLADQITLKNLLRDKLHREMQGFRVSSEEFKELEQVNPMDIRNIYSALEKKLGKLDLHQK